MDIIPQPVRGVVIHQKELVNYRLIDSYMLENLYLECTSLLIGGKEHPLYRRILLKISLGVACISTCMTKIIISQL